MPDGFSTEVNVKRRASDGWHVYTCDEMPGLFVSSKDDKVAYNDIPKSIEALLQLDLGISCTVRHKISYADFTQKIDLMTRAQEAVTERTDDLVANDDWLIFSVCPILEGESIIQ